MITRHRIDLNSTSDILPARLQARELAIRMGFGGFEVSLITAAISKVARFLVQHSRRGEILLEEVQQNGKFGISITALAEAARLDRKAEVQSISCGSNRESEPSVPNLRGLMDELDVLASASGDTTIVMKRWKSSCVAVHPRSISVERG
ncbi:MAG: hypothetical protein HY735_34970 [Verrucomicrobia bacterium]|nr:hypothetical protein [Verrucomicrobiota bacterium]